MLLRQDASPARSVTHLTDVAGNPEHDPSRISANGEMVPRDVTTFKG